VSKIAIIAQSIEESAVKEPSPRERISSRGFCWEKTMARYLLLFLLGVPIPFLILIWLFGGLN